MLEKVQKLIETNCQLIAGQIILVGVSGGPDSLTLMDVLERCGYPLVVAHLDHGLRPEASDDARHVEGIAASKGLICVVERRDVPAFAEKHKLSIEEAARLLRYQFLFEQAENHHAQAVAVGHNADDQVETVLMHLLRGTGIDGLTGMSVRSLPNPWSDSIPLVRPLLSIWRDEILTYCESHNLNPITDHTNREIKYFRNRLRHELIPELENYIPGIRARLFQTADLLTADRDLLETLTDQTWQDLVGETGDNFVTLHHSNTNLQPLALRRRLFRRAISHLRPGRRDIDFAMVQRLIDFSSQPTATGQIDLGLGLRAFLEDESLVIANWNSIMPTDHWPQIAEQFTLPVPGDLDLGYGWRLRVEIPVDMFATQLAAAKNTDPYRAWIDLGERQPSLIIRPRLPGDRFQPLGMEAGSMKLSDFMINQKIPQRARDGWPLVCVGNEIAWIPGHRLAHPFRVMERSRQIVRLSLLQPA